MMVSLFLLLCCFCCFSVSCWGQLDAFGMSVCFVSILLYYFLYYPIFIFFHFTYSALRLRQSSFLVVLLFVFLLFLGVCSRNVFSRCDDSRCEEGTKNIHSTSNCTGDLQTGEFICFVLYLFIHLSVYILIYLFIFCLAMLQAVFCLSRCALHLIRTLSC
jgi:hypothetical protein